MYWFQHRAPILTSPTLAPRRAVIRYGMWTSGVVDPSQSAASIGDRRSSTSQCALAVHERVGRCADEASGRAHSRPKAGMSIRLRRSGCHPGRQDVSAGPRPTMRDSLEVRASTTPRRARSSPSHPTATTGPVLRSRGPRPRAGLVQAVTPRAWPRRVPPAEADRDLRASAPDSVDTVAEDPRPQGRVPQPVCANRPPPGGRASPCTGSSTSAPMPDFGHVSSTCVQTARSRRAASRTRSGVDRQVRRAPSTSTDGDGDHPRRRKLQRSAQEPIRPTQRDREPRDRRTSRRRIPGRGDAIATMGRL